MLLLFNAWGISVGWDNGFLPGNEYRQTHTAITTLFIQREHNFSLAYPTPLLGKPWSVPYEFPLYQWTVVATSDATGLTLTQSARTVSAVCFYLALPAAWLLLGQLGLVGSRRLLPLMMVLSCPLYVFYARAFLIETMALMFSLWFLVAYVKAVKDRSIGWLIVANLAGSGAGLVKVTTFMLYLLPAAVWSVVRLWREAPRAGGGWRNFFISLGWMAAATAIPFALTEWWIKAADALKALNPSGRELISTVMTPYTFGTLQTRLTPEVWKTFGHTIVTHLAPFASLVIFAFVAAFWGGRWKKWMIAGVLVFAAGPLIFPLLYQWHEYYFAADGIVLMLALGLGLCALLESRLPRAVTWLLIIAIQAVQIWTYFDNLYPAQRFRSDGSSGLTRFVHDLTGPNDVLVIAGHDWAPMIPYYSQRRALMFRRSLDFLPLYRTAAFEALKGENVPVLILVGDARKNTDLIADARKYFGFEPTPIAAWEYIAVYVRPSLRQKVGRLFHDSVYGGLTLDHDASEQVAALESIETPTATLSPERRKIFELFSPEPVRFSARFPLGLLDIPPQRLIMAHPTSRIFFDPGSGRRQVSAVYGILPAAYENVPPTEIAVQGVEFSITRLRKNGTPEVIFKRLLDPKSKQSDRGRQILQLVVNVNPGEELVFATEPGPTGVLNRSWSYWETIKIQ
ncbi:MAG: hypothetical protein JWM35_948 [Verrucomicrobia bacterium]|nr:hypothetical protein [Verrucomicrobiota bacterium]